MKYSFFLHDINNVISYGSISKRLFLWEFKKQCQKCWNELLKNLLEAIFPVWLSVCLCFVNSFLLQQPKTINNETLISRWVPCCVKHPGGSIELSPESGASLRTAPKHRTPHRSIEFATMPDAWAQSSCSRRESPRATALWSADASHLFCMKAGHSMALKAHSYKAPMIWKGDKYLSSSKLSSLCLGEMG